MKLQTLIGLLTKLYDIHGNMDMQIGVDTLEHNETLTILADLDTLSLGVNKVVLTGTEERS